MKVVSVAPDVSTKPLLAGADFADAYRLEVKETTLDALAAARRVFARTPKWISGLLTLRNLIVAPFGLKAAATPAHVSARPGAPSFVGFFPVVSSAADRLVLGFDDRHLDFRVVVDVAPAPSERRSVTVTTLVRRHNWFGRAYLAVIKPFHRVIVRTMLARAAKP